MCIQVYYLCTTLAGQLSHIFICWHANQHDRTFWYIVRSNSCHVLSFRIQINANFHHSARQHYLIEKSRKQERPYKIYIQHILLSAMFYHHLQGGEEGNLFWIFTFDFIAFYMLLSIFFVDAFQLSIPQIMCLRAFFKKGI